MISNTYIGLSLLGICAVVGAGVGIGSGVAMIASVREFYHIRKNLFKLI